MAELLKQLYQEDELQFYPGIHGLNPWCENVIINSQVFSILDSESHIEPGRTVLHRLAISCFPHAQILLTPRTASGIITIGHHQNAIQFCNSSEFLCEVSKQIHELTALVIIQHCFELQEFAVISALVIRCKSEVNLFPASSETLTCLVPPLLLQHWNPSLIQVDEGRSSELTYSVLGKPTPLFYWCFHGHCVHNQEAFVDSNGLLHRIGLRISQARLEDEGEYYCCILKHHDLGFFTQTPVTKIKVLSKDHERSKRLVYVTPKLDVFPNLQLTAKRKVALLIGNTIFENFARLNDDTNMLQKLGGILQDHDFQIVTLQNLNSGEITWIIEQFEKVLSPGVYAFLYLGSHGLRLHGHEYILATDATLDGLPTDMTDTTSHDHESHTGLLRHKAERKTRMSLQELNKHGLISVDALTCRLNARSPSIAILVADACRQDYRVDQANQWTADKALQAVTALNFYNPSNLAVLYACQPGAAAYEGENSILCTILIHLMQNYGQQPIMNLLEKTCAQFERIRLLKDESGATGNYKLRECDHEDGIEQRPDLRPPQSMRHLQKPVFVITIAGNTRRAAQFDRETREQSDFPNAVRYRKLSDPVNDGGTSSMSGDLWVNANIAYSSPFQYLSVNNPAPKWFHARYISNNVLRLEIDADPWTGLPRACFESTSMKNTWKPCRVEPESNQSNPYVQLHGHHRIVLIRDLQRLNAPYMGIRPITIQVHRISSESFRVDPSGFRCACTVSPVTIGCPPIVRAWSKNNS